MQQAKEKQALDELAGKGIRIPPQPRVMVELNAAIASDDYDMRTIGRIISQDPGVVALLFKAARSPLFSRGRKLETIDQVLAVIGIKQTCNLVQAVALSTALSDGTRAAFEVFWTRAGEVAQIAAIIAGDKVSTCNVFPDQAYMAGIFHECGVPVLMMRFPDYCKALRLENVSCWPNLAEEDRRFNVDHCSVGYLVARHWGLPDFVCAAIRYHHELPTEELGAATSLVAILQLAIHYYHRINEQTNPLWSTIGHQVEEELGLAGDEVENYFEEISHRFHEAHR